MLLACGITEEMSLARQAHQAHFPGAVKFKYCSEGVAGTQPVGEREGISSGGKAKHTGSA